MMEKGIKRINREPEPSLNKKSMIEALPEKETLRSHKSRTVFPEKPGLK